MYVLRVYSNRELLLANPMLQLVNELNDLNPELTDLSNIGERAT